MWVSDRFVLLHSVCCGGQIVTANTPTFVDAGGAVAFEAEYSHGMVVPEVVVNAGVPAFPFLGSLDEPLSAALLSASPSPFGSDSESGRARKILNIAPSVIETYLIIGSKRDVADRDVLRDFGVTHVLNATPDCPCHFHDELSYLRLAIKVCTLGVV